MEKLVAPYLKRNEVEKLRQVYHELEDAQQDAVTAEEAARVKPKVADAWGLFLANPSRPQPRDVTLRDYSQRWGKFAAWWAQTAGDDRLFLEDIQAGDVAAFTKFMEDDKLSPNRYNKIVQTSSMVFALACREGTLNPFAAVRRKRLMTTSHREFSEDELRKIMKSSTGELHFLFALGLFTLLRLGDCCTLRWDEVNLKDDVIHRKPNKTSGRSNKVVTVSIHPVLRALLEDVPAKARKAYVLPETAASYRHDRTKICRQIQEHLNDCGITTQKDAGTKVMVAEAGFHSFRHTGASLMARAGIPQAILQHLLGHASPALQAVYVHTNSADIRRAVDAIPDIMREDSAEADDEQAKPPRDTDKLEQIRARLSQERGGSKLLQDLETILSS